MRLDRRRNRGNAGMYKGEDYDLAGFTVGVVEAEGIIDGSGIKCDDVLMACRLQGCILTAIRWPARP